MIIGAGGYLGLQFYLDSSAPPPAPPPKAKAPAVAPTASAPKTAAPTPSEALNQLAQAPANAINKAQEAIAARRASGQNRVDGAVLGEELADKPAVVPEDPAAKDAALRTTTAVTTVRPGLSATVEIDAAVEASAAFRSFVANAKVSGVFQGTPARAFINGRVTRSGETVDGALGITFEGIDADRRQLVFKDKSGATVSRRY